MNALVWDEILPFDLLPTSSSRAPEAFMRAFFCSVAFNAASGNYFLTILIGTADSDIIAHIGNEPGCLSRAGQKEGATGRALGAGATGCSGAIFLQAGVAECMITLKHNRLEEGNVAYGAH